MTDFVPALPGTFLVNADGRPGQPVVAWHVTPAQAFPITPFVRKGITAGEGVWFADPDGDGLLYDLVWKKVFPSTEAWRDAVAVDKPYEMGTVRGANIRAVETATTAAAAPSEFLHAKTYERKSYWQFQNGDNSYLIEIEPGKATPRPERADKITREKFTELKNSGMTVMGYESLLAPVNLADEDPREHIFDDDPPLKPVDEDGGVDPHEDAVGMDPPADDGDDLI